MGCHEDGAAPGGAADNLDQIDLRGLVELGGRLIKDENRRVLQEGPSETDATTFTA